MHFDVRGPVNKSTRDHTLTKLLQSPGLMVSASGVSNTKFLPSDPYDICDRIKLLLQQKQAGNNFIIINDDFIVIVDKLLEKNCISAKQHRQILIICNLLHKEL